MEKIYLDYYIYLLQAHWNESVNTKPDEGPVRRIAGTFRIRACTEEPDASKNE